MSIQPSARVAPVAEEAFGVELLLEVHQMLAESLQHRGARARGRTPFGELWADDLAAVGERPAKSMPEEVDLNDMAAPVAVRLRR